MEAGQSNRVVAIIQARMQSTRLPGKVLLPMPFFGERSILGQILAQLGKSKYNPTIVVATSTHEADYTIAEYCIKNKVLFYRGNEKNVHSRFLEILQNSDFQTAIRITADNPILDIDSLDIVLENHNQSNSDYSYTTDLPLGMNFEVFNVKAFLKMNSKELSSEDKEHVTLKFRNDSSFTKNQVIINTGIQDRIWLTIDYPSDYLLLSMLFEISQRQGIEPGLKLVSYALKNHSWLFTMNQQNLQRRQFNNLNEEIQYSIDVLKALDLINSAKYLASHV
jgi:spore coat polysaccharide biosynthesis protein SpsF